jgi:hypothetical protein
MVYHFFSRSFFFHIINTFIRQITYPEAFAEAIKDFNTEDPCSSSFLAPHETSRIIWIGKPAAAIQC